MNYVKKNPTLTINSLPFLERLLCKRIGLFDQEPQLVMSNKLPHLFMAGVRRTAVFVSPGFGGSDFKEYGEELDTFGKFTA